MTRLLNTPQGRTPNLSNVLQEMICWSFTHVNYSIPCEKGERKPLNDALGFARPGNLLTLMGVSGAGETTLLTTLAQRYNVGLVSGDFLADGRPLPRSFQQATGFAEQEDVHESPP